MTRSPSKRLQIFYRAVNKAKVAFQPESNLVMTPTGVEVSPATEPPQNAKLV